MKKAVWYNTCQEDRSHYFKRILNQKEIDILNMLWSTFRLTYITQSAFFENIRVGDDDYELWVHKSRNGVLTIKFIIL